MGLGYLKVETRTLNDILPVMDVAVIIKDNDGNVLYRLKTDKSGVTPLVELEAPEKRHTLSPNYSGPYYSTYNVEVSKEKFVTKILKGIQVFDTITSRLPVIMIPKPLDSGNIVDVTEIPDIELYSKEARKQQESEIEETRNNEIVIPEHVIVHLGNPEDMARNIKVRFIDYIKNVVSGEIYPTWPKDSLEANIYAITTFTLHRLFSKHYRNMGYNFDITNSIIHDQAFTEGRSIAENVEKLVNEVFSLYVGIVESKEPLFTKYCNGITKDCQGLSKWETVYLSNKGLNPIQIIRNYYPKEIEIMKVGNINKTMESIEKLNELSKEGRSINIDGALKNTVLKLGIEGEEVSILQFLLTYISLFYNAISTVTRNGIFDDDTKSAVIGFQKLFGLTTDGIVGEDTWAILKNAYKGIIETIINVK